MKLVTKLKIFIVLLIILSISGGYLYFRYYPHLDKKVVPLKTLESFTGESLTVTIFSHDGKIIKRWTGVKKVKSWSDDRNYTFFYTRDGKYVQIPNSVWYLAEEE